MAGYHFPTIIFYIFPLADYGLCLHNSLHKKRVSGFSLVSNRYHRIFLASHFFLEVERVKKWKVLRD